jgi:UDP-GlcNAc:undecaprenyl-phosphate GlcNAc-1-phosphate transferase
MPADEGESARRLLSSSSLPMLYPLFVVGLIAFATAFAATPACRKLALRLEILDHPSGGRKIHARPTPYLGGLAVLAGLLAALAAAPALAPELSLELDGLRVFLIGATAACLLGLLDDLKPLPALAKLAATLLIGWHMWNGGCRIGAISLPGGGAAALDAASWGSLALTAGWFALVMHAINVIDGMDGLAAGICSVAGAALFAMAATWSGGESVLAPAIAAAAAGAAAGFLPHNWPPARIFLGDAGSLLLGFSLASAAALSQTKSASLVALAVPLMALGVPLMDISFALIRRLRRGENPFRGDRSHIHHRLMDIGLPPSRVLAALCFATAALGAQAWTLRGAGIVPIALNLALMAAGFGLAIDAIRHISGGGRRD